MIETIPIFLPNKGQVLDVPEEFLLESVSPYSRNVEYYNELLQSRLGLEKFSNTALSGRVMLQFLLKLANDDTFNLFFTPKDIYVYDFTNSRFDILTPTYTTGTITISAGSLNIVTGSGTSWSANLKAGDYIKIGSGGIHTGSTWYEIQSVDSDTQVTLTSNAVETTAGTAYVARKIFNGGNADFWTCTKFTDSSLGDIIVATNGVDTPVYWPGSGQVVAITGLPDGMKAKYVASFKDRVVFAWTVEGGNNQPERVRASDVANANSYPATLFEDLIDDGSGITGMIRFGDYLIVTKEKTFYQGRYVGGDAVFDYDPIAGPEGCKSHRSLVKSREWLYYYCWDKKFHRWNLVTDQVISEEVFKETKNFDPNLEQYITGDNFYHKNQIRWFCPYSSTDYQNYILVFDYKTETVQIWNCGQEQALLSIGSYYLKSDLYLDDAVWGDYYLDEQSGYWDDINYLSAAPVFLYGGYDGYVRKCDTGDYDDAVAFIRVLRFKRLNFQAQHINKRLHKQQWWFEQEAAGSVSLSHYLDDRDSSHPNSKTITLSESGKDIVKRTVTLDIEAENFQPEIQSTCFFALLGFLNYVMPKGSA